MGISKARTVCAGNRGTVPKAGRRDAVSSGTRRTMSARLAAGTVAALLVPAGGARAADDDHAAALATILGVRHLVGWLLFGGDGSGVCKVVDVESVGRTR